MKEENHGQSPSSICKKSSQSTGILAKANTCRAAQTPEKHGGSGYFTDDLLESDAFDDDPWDVVTQHLDDRINLIVMAPCGEGEELSLQL
jgi:hypothetical protein